jgi:hypothetical protein
LPLDDAPTTGPIFSSSVNTSLANSVVTVNGAGSLGHQSKWFVGSISTGTPNATRRNIGSAWVTREERDA